MFSCATSDASGYVNIPGRRAGTAPYEFALAHDASPELPFLGSEESGERGHFAFVRIVQTKPMEQNEIGFVGTDEMRSGIEAARLEPRGAGAGEPVAFNDDDSGRTNKLRVELVWPP